MIIFRCIGGFFVGLFVMAFGGMVSGLILEIFFGLKGRLPPLVEFCGGACGFVIIGFFTIRPLLEQQKADREHNERMMQEQRRITQEKAHEELRQREKKQYEDEQRRSEESKSRNDLQAFLKLIADKSTPELRRLKQEKEERLDELRRERKIEEQEHYEFVSDPENRGCMDAAMDHHRRVYHAIDIEVKQISLEMGKLNAAMH